MTAASNLGAGPSGRNDDDARKFTGWVASKSMTAASTRAASCGSVWAWRVAPVIEDSEPAVRTAPAPMRYSLMVGLWGPRVPTGWRFPNRRKKSGGAVNGASRPQPGLCGVPSRSRQGE